MSAEHHIYTVSSITVLSRGDCENKELFILLQTPKDTCFVQTRRAFPNFKNRSRPFSRLQKLITQYSE